MITSSSRVDELFAGLAFSDAIIAKATRLSEVARLAKIEARLRGYLLAKWNIRRTEAVELAGRMAEQGKTPSAIASAIERIMGQWAEDVERVFRKELADVYEISRVAAWKKATGETTAPLVFDTPNFTDERVEKARRRIARTLPSFDATDTSAITAIQDQQMFWIGEHYGKNVDATIRRVSRESMLEAGRDRRAAGKLMRRRVREELGRVKTPKGFRGSTIQYMEGLAANATTVARNFGNVVSFADLGVTTYRINNPMDSRTCPVCSHMDGKQFTVEHGKRQMISDLSAKNPDDIRKGHPWKPIGEIQKISPKAGHQSTGDSKSLADAGFALPSYHFRCRCTIDVTFEAGSTIPAGLTGKRAEFAKNFPQLANVAGKLPEDYFNYSPTTPFNPKAIETAISQKVFTKEAQVEVRQQVQALLQERGIVMHFNRSGWRPLLSVKEIPASGTHGWTGSVTIDKLVWGDVEKGAKRGILRGVKAPASGIPKLDHRQQANAIRTVIHEEVHHASPIAPGVYKGPGVVLEEVTTEIAARKIISDVAGIELDLVSGAYQNYINGMVEGLSDVLGVKAVEAKKVLVNASMKLRRAYQEKIFETPEEYFQHFSKQVPSYINGQAAPAPLGEKARGVFEIKLARGLESRAVQAYKGPP